MLHRIDIIPYLSLIIVFNRQNVSYSVAHVYQMHELVVPQSLGLVANTLLWYTLTSIDIKVYVAIRVVVTTVKVNTYYY